MEMKEGIKKLEKLKHKAFLGGGRQRIEKLRREGYLLAEERINLFLDPGTFVELGTLADPQVLSLIMVVEIDSPHVGKAKDVGSPVKVSGVDQVRYIYPPALGEHTELVLKDPLGYSTEKIAALKNQKVV